MNDPKELMGLIEAAIKERFDVKGISSIEITSIDVDHSDHKIRIELRIETSEKPDELARRYFGLTGKVRDALGSEWSGFFPVITPQFTVGLNA